MSKQWVERSDEEAYLADMADSEEAWLHRVEDQEQHYLYEALARMKSHQSSEDDHALIISHCGMTKFFKEDK